MEMTNDIYINIGAARYRAQINGIRRNPDWDDRQTKAITLEMTHQQALGLFTDGVAWSIEIHGQIDGVAQESQVYDNSHYSLSGPITDHRDGTVTVVMGKPTQLEEALVLLLGQEVSRGYATGN